MSTRGRGRGSSPHRGHRYSDDRAPVDKDHHRSDGRGRGDSGQPGRRRDRDREERSRSPARRDRDGEHTFHFSHMLIFCGSYGFLFSQTSNNSCCITLRQKRIS